MITKRDFVSEINWAMQTKPAGWRDGQTVFNYIDGKYGVARDVQYLKHVDCFNDDAMIQSFINAAYELLRNGNVHDYPGNNMIEE